MRGEWKAHDKCFYIKRYARVRTLWCGANSGWDVSIKHKKHIQFTANNSIELAYDIITLSYQSLFDKTW